MCSFCTKRNNLICSGFFNPMQIARSVIIQSDFATSGNGDKKSILILFYAPQKIAWKFLDSNNVRFLAVFTY